MREAFVDSPHVSLHDLVAQLAVPSGVPLFAAKIDVSDFYHRLKLPQWMVPYFCLPPVCSSELPGLVERFGFAVKVYPCLLTLPMGFSHAVYLAQAAHMRLSVDRLRFLIYIDDVVFLSTVCALVGDAQKAHLRTLDRRRLPAKQFKVMLPTSGYVDVLGVELHGETGAFVE